jgi:DNA-binding LytR/AlgR family response regulator
MNTPPSPTALIAEDEPLLAAHLGQELRRLWPELKLLDNVADGHSALEGALARQPDVLFLDIRMPGLTGLEVAQALAEDWPYDKPLPLIVFVTAYDQYAARAFDNAAVDYLLKPVQPERLAKCCARLQDMLRQSAAGAGDEAARQAALEATLGQLRQLLASPAPAANSAVLAGGAGTTSAMPTTSRLSVIQAGVGAAIHMVPIDEVLYFEAADKYVRVITAQREHLIRTSLRELLPQLDEQRFWQVHRGTIVRADAIATAVREESGKVTLTLRGVKDKLTASRLYAHRFKPM